MKFKAKAQQKGKPAKGKRIPAPEHEEAMGNRHLVTSSLMYEKLTFEVILLITP